MNYFYAACLLLLCVSFAFADHHGHEKPTFCSEDKAKCELAGINVTCVENADCAKYVADNKASLTLAKADDLVKYEDKLKIVYGQKLKGLDKFVQYYGLAVVQKNSTINLSELKGKKSCHTGVGKTVGWKIPVGYLLYKKEMTFTDNQYTSASNFFGDSCAPGIKDEKVSNEVKKDFCKLCNNTCSSKDGYAGYAGAFKCMAKGNNDRVGFVKQDTAGEVVDGNEYGKKGDYKLLCTDGKTKDLDNYKSCYIAKRPLFALVTSKDTADAMVTKWQNILNNANLADLEKGGIVSNGTEKLEEYKGSVKDYVGDYGKYFNALSGPGDTSSAPSSFSSFAVQVIAIFAFVFLG